MVNFQKNLYAWYARKMFKLDHMIQGKNVMIVNISNAEIVILNKSLYDSHKRNINVLIAIISGYQRKK